MTTCVTIISRVRRSTATAMSVYGLAAEKTTATSRTLPKTTLPDYQWHLPLCEDLVEGDDQGCPQRTPAWSLKVPAMRASRLFATSLAGLQSHV